MGTGRHNWFNIRSTSPFEGASKEMPPATPEYALISWGCTVRWRKAVPTYWKGWNASKGTAEACSYGNTALPSGSSATNWRSLSFLHYGTQHFCKRWQEHANRERLGRVGCMDSYYLCKRGCDNLPQKTVQFIAACYQARSFQKHDCLAQAVCSEHER